MAKALKEAGLAFAPLIFDLNVNANFKEFMNLCETVWANYTADKNICHKLIYFDRDKIDALNKIKEKKGNVEMSSIDQAKEYNLKGVYRVGNFYSELIQNGVVNIDKISNVANLIEFEIDSQLNFTNRNKVLTYEKLTELQNILLLVKSDEGDDDEKDLEYFIEIFKYVVRLSHSYLSLLQNGCDFFEEFSFYIYCDIKNQRIGKRLPTVVVNLPSDYVSVVNGLKSLENFNDPTNVCLKKLCIFVENCLEQWKNYLENIRNQYTCINYFNINQIMILRANMGKF